MVAQFPGPWSERLRVNRQHQAAAHTAAVIERAQLALNPQRLILNLREKGFRQQYRQGVRRAERRGTCKKKR